MEKGKTNIFKKSISITFLVMLLICSVLIIPIETSFAKIHTTTNQETSEMFPIVGKDIKVDSHTLDFDLSESEKVGKMTSTYDFRTSKEMQTVKMCFPMINSIKEFKENQIKISFNNNEIPFQAYVGKIEMPDVISLTSDTVITATDDFEEGEIEKIKGELWEIKDEHKNENIIIEFDINYEETYLLYNNTNEYLSESKNTSNPLIARVSFALSDDFFMFISGNELENLNIYNKDTNTQYSQDIINKTAKTLKDIYDDNFGDTNISDKGSITVDFEDNYYNKINGENNECDNLDDFIDKLINERLMFFMVYEVELKKDVANIVKISYDIKGKYDSKYEEIVYKYYYITEISKLWEDFDKTTVNITMNDKYSYLVNENIDFDKNGENSYSYTTDGVIEKNISFSISDNENPGIYSNSNNHPHHNVFLILIIFGSLLIIGIIICIIIILTRKRKIKKEK